MNSTSLAYCNGVYQPGPLTIPTHDPGFLWGATVTDRLRTYLRQPFRLAEHLNRFRRSAEQCRIPLTPDNTVIGGIIAELLNRWRDQSTEEAVVILWATPARFGIEVQRFNPEPYRPMVRHGARLITSATQPVPPGCVPRSAKMRSRLHWWIAEHDAKVHDPQAMAVLVDPDGSVTETALANVLAVFGTTIVSPPTERILPGVSRDFVRDLSPSLRLSFVERPLSVEEAQGADELLLTSTPFGVCGVSRWDGVDRRFPGPVLEKLHRRWSETVGRDIWAEFIS